MNSIKESVVSLVPWRPEYAERQFQWSREADTLRFNPIEQVPLDVLREGMAKMSSNLADLEGAKVFRFFVQVGEELVGTVTLSNVNLTMWHAEIGYTIGEKFQRRGIGTEAVQAFVKKVYAETPLRRLFAFVAEENIASRRVLEKVGFLLEGVCREHYLINGIPTNEALYGLLRSDPMPSPRF